MTSQLAKLAARIQAPHVIVFGWGDGSIANALAENPAKDVLAIRLPGESGGPLKNGLVATISDKLALRALVYNQYVMHTDIPRLGGVVIVEDHPLESDEAKIFRDENREYIRQLLTDQPQLYGNDIIDSFMGIYHASQNARQLLGSPTLRQTKGICGQTPVIAIGAGPSLGRHIERLRELQHRCVLVACDAVLPGLLAEGIQPHFATPLERLRANAAFVQEVRGTRTIYAGLPVCHPDTVAPFEDRVVAVGAHDKIYDWLDSGNDSRITSGSSTGVLSITFALHISTGPVYLVGHDLAREESGRSHWSSATLATSDFRDIKSQKLGFGTGYDDRLVPGNNGGMVPSIQWWDRFRMEISNEVIASGRQVFNTNAHDGIFAKIEGCRAAHLPDGSDLPLLPDLRLPEKDHGAFDRWFERAKKMPEDAHAFIKHLEALSSDIAGMLSNRNHDEWDVDLLVTRLNLHDGISEGNRAAYAYTLRSALHNSLAYYHTCLFKETEAVRAKYLTLKHVDALAQGLINATRQLIPCMERMLE